KAIRGDGGQRRLAELPVGLDRRAALLDAHVRVAVGPGRAVVRIELVSRTRRGDARQVLCSAVRAERFVQAGAAVRFLAVVVAYESQLQRIGRIPQKLATHAAAIGFVQLATGERLVD